MNMVALLNMALSSLWHHSMRSFLTMLGIVFGVAAVVAMLAISAGARDEALRAIQNMGLYNIVISSEKPTAVASSNSGNNSSVLSYGLTHHDRRRLSELLPQVRDMVMTKEVRQKVFAGSERVDARVVATVPAYGEITGLAMARGRWLNQLDEQSKQSVCVLGHDLGTALFGPIDPLGQLVRVGPTWLRVVGILGPKTDPAPAMGLAAEHFNKTLYLPFVTNEARFGETSIQIESGGYQAESVVMSDLIVRFESGVDVVKLGELTRRLLAETHTNNEDISVVVPLELLQQQQRTQAIFTIVMSSIAGISLLVGGIGIMNIMLASVLERTREIGIRRAVGATRRAIVSQFLVETVVLSFLGGVLGVLLGIAAASAVSAFAEWPTQVAWWSVILSLGISALVGIVFGTYPAIRAARLQPVAALRHE